MGFIKEGGDRERHKEKEINDGGRRVKEARKRSRGERGGKDRAKGRVNTNVEVLA